MAEREKMQGVAESALLRALIEQGGGKVASIGGYVWPATEDKVRLYADLSLLTCIEMAMADIVRIVPTCDEPHAPAIVYFKHDAEIVYVKTATMRGDQVLAAAMAASSKPACGCGGSEVPPGSIARQQQGGGGGTTTLDFCPLCGFTLDICKALNPGWGAFWCYLEYAFCRLGCLNGPVVGLNSATQR